MLAVCVCVRVCVSTRVCACHACACVCMCTYVCVHTCVLHILLCVCVCVCVFYVILWWNISTLHDCGFAEIFDELGSALDELQNKPFADSKDMEFLQAFVKSPATTQLCDVSTTVLR